MLDYLIDLNKTVEEALEQWVNKLVTHDKNYLDVITARDTKKKRGLKNILRLCASKRVGF